MPRPSASNGIRPEIRALAVFPLGATVTPDIINTHVGTGDYAAKYVSFLNTRYGFKITANKDGRKVVSYTMIAEPDNAADLRSMQPKAPKLKVKSVKAPKVAAPKAVAKTKAPVPTTAGVARVSVTKDKEAIKAKNLATLKAVAAKRKKVKVREFDDVTETFGTSGEVGTSFNVDRDWDSVEGLDLSKLL